jgi:hypothetical protein
MTDRELLEAAARAAGLTIHAGHQACRDACGAGDVGLWISNVTTCWNPLTSDSDALRLAVKLEIDLCFGANYVIADGEQVPTVNNAGNPCAAVRYAITRAAAAMAKDAP